MRVFAKYRALAAAALVCALVMAAAPAVASSFTFGGDNYEKIKSKGQLDTYLAPVTGTSAGGGDALNSMYVGIFNFDLFDVIGTKDATVGEVYSNLDYDISQQKSVLSPNVYVTSEFFRKQGPSKKHLPDTWDLSANLNLTSVSFDSDYQITLKGYLSDISISKSTSSAVLADMAGSQTADFLMTLYRTDKTSGKFIPVLQSSKGSTWAGVSGVVSSGTPVAGTPEPGTLLLLTSGLAGLAGWRWRCYRRSC